jgi:hypothetical protein
MKSNLFLLTLVLPFLATPFALADNQPKKGEISIETATAIALKKVNGKIKSSEYEFEKGQNVYSFDINGRDGKIHENLVSAKSGSIVSSTIESASKEAAEESADQKN